MKELSLRQRVNLLRKSDPEFFADLTEWKKEFKENSKSFMDRPMTIRKIDMVTKHVTKHIVPWKDEFDASVKRFWDEDDGLVPA